MFKKGDKISYQGKSGVVVEAKHVTPGMIDIRLDGNPYDRRAPVSAVTPLARANGSRARLNSKKGRDSVDPDPSKYEGALRPGDKKDRRSHEQKVIDDENKRQALAAFIAAQEKTRLGAELENELVVGLRNFGVDANINALTGYLTVNTDNALTQSRKFVSTHSYHDMRDMLSVVRNLADVPRIEENERRRERGLPSIPPRALPPIYIDTDQNIIQPGAVPVAQEQEVVAFLAALGNKSRPAPTSITAEHIVKAVKAINRLRVERQEAPTTLDELANNHPGRTNIQALTYELNLEKSLKGLIQYWTKVRSDLGERAPENLSFYIDAAFESQYHKPAGLREDVRIVAGRTLKVQSDADKAKLDNIRKNEADRNRVKPVRAKTDIGKDIKVKGAGVFTRADPPRLAPFAAGHQAEMCGNTIDGVAYYLAVTDDSPENKIVMKWRGTGKAGDASIESAFIAEKGPAGRKLINSLIETPTLNVNTDNKNDIMEHVWAEIVNYYAGSATAYMTMGPGGPDMSIKPNVDGPVWAYVTNHVPKPPNVVLAAARMQGYQDMFWYGPFVKASIRIHAVREAKRKVRGQGKYEADISFHTPGYFKVLTDFYKGVVRPNLMRGGNTDKNKYSRMAYMFRDGYAEGYDAAPKPNKVIRLASKPTAGAGGVKQPGAKGEELATVEAAKEEYETYDPSVNFGYVNAGGMIDEFKLSTLNLSEEELSAMFSGGAYNSTAMTTQSAHRANRNYMDWLFASSEGGAPTRRGASASRRDLTIADLKLRIREVESKVPEAITAEAEAELNKNSRPGKYQEAMNKLLELDNTLAVLRRQLITLQEQGDSNNSRFESLFSAATRAVVYPTVKTRSGMSRIMDMFKPLGMIQERVPDHMEGYGARFVAEVLKVVGPYAPAGLPDIVLSALENSCMIWVRSKSNEDKDDSRFSSWKLVTDNLRILGGDTLLIGNKSKSNSPYFSWVPTLVTTHQNKHTATQKRDLLPPCLTGTDRRAANYMWDIAGVVGQMSGALKNLRAKCKEGQVGWGDSQRGQTAEAVILSAISGLQYQASQVAYNLKQLKLAELEGELGASRALNEIHWPGNYSFESDPEAPAHLYGHDEPHLEVVLSSTFGRKGNKKDSLESMEAYIKRVFDTIRTKEMPFAVNDVTPPVFPLPPTAFDFIQTMANFVEFKSTANGRWEGMHPLFPIFQWVRALKGPAFKEIKGIHSDQWQPANLKTKMEEELNGIFRFDVNLMNTRDVSKAPLTTAMLGLIIMQLEDYGIHGSIKITEEGTLALPRRIPKEKEWIVPFTKTHQGLRLLNTHLTKANAQGFLNPILLKNHFEFDERYRHYTNVGAASWFAAVPLGQLLKSIKGDVDKLANADLRLTWDVAHYLCTTFWDQLLAADAELNKEREEALKAMKARVVASFLYYAARGYECFGSIVETDKAPLRSSKSSCFWDRLKDRLQEKVRQETGGSPLGKGSASNTFKIYMTYNPVLYQLTKLYWPNKTNKRQLWNGVWSHPQTLKQIDDVGRYGFLQHTMQECTANLVAQGDALTLDNISTEIERRIQITMEKVTNYHPSELRNIVHAIMYPKAIIERDEKAFRALKIAIDHSLRTPDGTLIPQKGVDFLGCIWPLGQPADEMEAVLWNLLDNPGQYITPLRKTIQKEVPYSMAMSRTGILDEYTGARLDFAAMPEVKAVLRGDIAETKNPEVMRRAAEILGVSYGGELTGSGYRAFLDALARLNANPYVSPPRLIGTGSLPVKEPESDAQAPFSTRYGFASPAARVPGAPPKLDRTTLENLIALDQATRSPIQGTEELLLESTYGSRRKPRKVKSRNTARSSAGVEVDLTQGQKQMAIHPDSWIHRVNEDETRARNLRAELQRIDQMLQVLTKSLK